MTANPGAALPSAQSIKHMEKQEISIVAPRTVPSRKDWWRSTAWKKFYIS